MNPITKTAILTQGLGQLTDYEHLARLADQFDKIAAYARALATFERAKAYTEPALRMAELARACHKAGGEVPAVVEWEVAITVDGVAVAEAVTEDLPEVSR